MGILWFIAGVIAGSAANALIDRLPRGESWVRGRSKCDSCKHELGFWDLIPLLSYLWLRGRCRYCRKKIPMRNFWVELGLGVGFFLISYLGNLGDLSYLMMAILWVTM